jgi:integrase/recombinase XerD
MAKNWTFAFKDFKSYLKLEKSLSENSVDAYLNDVAKLKDFFNETGRDYT